MQNEVIVQKEYPCIEITKNEAGEVMEIKFDKMHHSVFFYPDNTINLKDWADSLQQDTKIKVYNKDELIKEMNLKDVKDLNGKTFNEVVTILQHRKTVTPPSVINENTLKQLEENSEAPSGIFNSILRGFKESDLGRKIFNPEEKEEEVVQTTREGKNTQVLTPEVTKQEITIKLTKLADGRIEVYNGEKDDEGKEGVHTQIKNGAFTNENANLTLQYNDGKYNATVKMTPSEYKALTDKKADEIISTIKAKALETQEGKNALGRDLEKYYIKRTEGVGAKLSRNILGDGKIKTAKDSYTDEDINEILGKIAGTKKEVTVHNGYKGNTAMIKSDSLDAIFQKHGVQLKKSGYEYGHSGYTSSKNAEAQGVGSLLNIERVYTKQNGAGAPHFESSLGCWGNENEGFKITQPKKSVENPETLQERESHLSDNFKIEIIPPSEIKKDPLKNPQDLFINNNVEACFKKGGR